jgi:hypothetical protein
VAILEDLRASVKARVLEKRRKYHYALSIIIREGLST